MDPVFPQVAPGLLMLVLFLTPWTGVALTPMEPQPGPVLVGWAKDDPLPALGSRVAGLAVTDVFPRAHAVRLEATGTADGVIRILAGDPSVRYAAREPMLTAATHIQEPRLAEQGHHKPIRSPTAWHITTGSTATRLAIIDSGIDPTHEEFAGRIVASHDLLDDDDVVQDTCDHGTAVAGLAAADPDNRKGGAGIADVSLLVARVMTPQDGVCEGPLGDTAEALLWAADHGARVALISMASTVDHPALAEAVQNVSARGVLVVAAAGNTRGGDVRYPAAYPEVLAVGSVRNDKALSTFSPSGPVDLVAPGEDLLTSVRGGGYGRVTGTSASAPLVAGTAALMVSIAPNITREQLTTFLTETADDIRSPGYDPASGHGVLDTLAAADRSRDLVNTAPWIGHYARTRVKVGHESAFPVRSYDRDGDVLTFSATGLPPNATIDPATGTLSWRPTDSEAGIHAFTVTVTDGRAETHREGRLEAYLNPPPEAVLSGPARVEAGAATVFDASGSADADRTALTFEWDEDLSDGEDYVTGSATRSITWPVPGRYTVGTRVTDADGATALATIAVVVDDALVGEPVFETRYGPEDRIRGSLRLDWIGGDDRTRIDVQVQRYHIVDAPGGPRFDPSGQRFFFAVDEDGGVAIDLAPDVPASDGTSGRNLPGVHELVIVATLVDSLNGDVERWQQTVRYTVPASE